VKGAPCNECVSCRSLLKDGTSADFTEVDAATNSGKAEVTRIKEEIQYSSFSGRQRIYLFDEAHQLTKEALDALLKPMEDPIAGTQNKQLVCIFCTTEPEKMRATVLSRCAPAFVIEPQSPEVIAKRLAFICGEEGIKYEEESLQLVAEITECHIRDALKAIEGVSMLGEVSRKNVSAYLHLDLNTAYLDILDALGTNLSLVLEKAREALGRVSPVVCYEKLADAAMAAFQVALGVKGATHWDRERLTGLSSRGDVLLGYVDRFASRPGRPTMAMLLCDLSVLHHGAGGVGDTVVLQVAVPVPVPAPALVETAPVPSSVKVNSGTVEVVQAAPEPSTPKKASAAGSMKNALTDDPNSPMFVDPRAVARPENQRKRVPKFVLGPELFCDLLAKTLAEMRSHRAAGSTR